MKLFWKNALIALVFVLVIILIIFFITPDGRRAVNQWFFEVQKADDATRYSTRKEVEDSCRAMMASYTSDRLTYEQYKDSDIEEKQTWAEQARMRANKTAAVYNEFILKNSFVWAENAPKDILSDLPFLTDKETE